ncbi:MAG: O-antigen ligase family protein [Thermodesulfobacteriota bacterium]
MQYIKNNYINITVFSLVVLTAYLLGQVIVDSPGTSMSRWIFGLAPVGVVVMAIAVVIVSGETDLRLSSFFGLPRLNASLGFFLLCIALAAAVGVLIVLNPFDFILPILIATTVCLTVFSFYMLINRKMIDALGLLLISFPFLTYIEHNMVSWKTAFIFEWVTIKISVIIVFAFVWFVVTVFVDRRTFVKGRFDALVLIFIGVAFLSAILSVDSDYSLKRWLFEVVYPVSFYFIIVNRIRDEKEIIKLISYLVAGVFLNLTLVLYFFAKYGGKNSLLNEHMLHLSFADGVLIANVLIMVIPIVVAFLATAEEKRIKVLCYILIAVGLMGLVLSFARMTQACMLVGLLAFGLNKKTRKFVLLSLVAALIVFAVNSDKMSPYLSKYRGLTSIEDIVHTSSMEKRYGGWKAALGMVKDRPVTGVGVGRFSKEYSNYGTLYYSKWASGYVPMISAHNFYLTFLAETGVLGLIVLVLIFLTLLRSAVRLVKNTKSYHIFKLSLLISLSIFLANNFVDGITFAYVNEIDKGAIFWTLAAVIMSFTYIEKSASKNLKENTDKGVV